MEDDDEDLEGAELADETEPDDVEEDDEGEGVDGDEDAETEEASPADGRDSEGDPAPKDKSRKAGLTAAAHAERQRRQKAEDDLRKLREELAYLKGQITAAPKPARAEEPEEEDEPLDLTNLDASVDKRVEKRAQRLLSRRERERAEAEAKEWEERVAYSQREARAEYEDYDEVETRFRSRAASDPSLGRLVRAQADPAEWAYQNQLRFEKRQARGSSEVEALKARIAELEGKAGKKPAKPRSLADARGAGVRARVNSGVPDAASVFSDTFKRKGA